MVLKILCLHGYRQDAEYFKKKFGAFRKIVKNVTDLVFIDAPHVIPNEEPVEGQCLRQSRGWWFSRKDSTFDPLMTTNVCMGFEESIQLINTMFETQGPFDGILGFSQGAAMAALLCALQEGPFDGILGFSQGAAMAALLCALQEVEETKEFQHKFGFVILIAGFVSKYDYHKSLFTSQITIPSLHIIGENDQVIPKIMSEELSQYFNFPKVLYHPGGHFIPTSSTYKTEYMAFLAEMVERSKCVSS